MSKDPIRCRLEINGKTVEQVKKVNYLRAQITSNYKPNSSKYRARSVKASKISGSERDLMQGNKYLSSVSGQQGENL